MKNQVFNFTLKQIICALCVCLLVFSSVLASDPADVVRAGLNSKMTSSLIIKNLTERLKTELVQENVAVKLGNVEQIAVSRNEIKTRGEATAILPAEKTQLPLRFEAKVNLATQSVDNIHYIFVESEYIPTSEEEILMKEIMNRLSRDYQTREIVIAIDNFESFSSPEDKIQYKGVGEVRIGQFNWSKINFDVVLNSDKTTVKIQYKIEK